MGRRLDIEEGRIGIILDEGKVLGRIIGIEGWKRR